MIIYVIHTLLITQLSILTLFVIQSINQRKKCNKAMLCGNTNIEYIDVIIAARENFQIVKDCIDNVVDAGFVNIYVCVDGDTNNISNELRKNYPSINILQNKNILGKIRSQIRCLKVSKNENVLILDADIRLILQDVNGFLSYYNSVQVDFLCPYSIGISEQSNFILFGIEESDRYMRQRVVRAGRDAYGVSNLSAYCMLANKKKYLDIIDENAIQDDVLATINLLEKRYTVKTYHKAVCSEIERTSFISYILQKTRWTAGNILLLKSYPNLFRVTNFTKAFAFTSSFLLWYWASWIDFVAIIMTMFYPFIGLILLIEYAVKFIGLIFASKPMYRIFNNFMYVILWPFISIMCLLLTPFYLSGQIIEQKTRR